MAEAIETFEEGITRLVALALFQFVVALIQISLGAGWDVLLLPALLFGTTFWLARSASRWVAILVLGFLLMTLLLAIAGVWHSLDEGAETAYQKAHHAWHVKEFAEVFVIGTSWKLIEITRWRPQMGAKPK